MSSGGGKGKEEITLTDKEIKSTGAKMTTEKERSNESQPSRWGKASEPNPPTTSHSYYTYLPAQERAWEPQTGISLVDTSSKGGEKRKSSQKKEPVYFYGPR